MQMKAVTFILILCLAQSLFVIPVFCNLDQISLSAQEDHCPLKILSAVSNALILPEKIINISKPHGNMVLSEIQIVRVLPDVLMETDKPPQNPLST